MKDAFIAPYWEFGGVLGTLLQAVTLITIYQNETKMTHTVVHLVARCLRTNPHSPFV